MPFIEAEDFAGPRPSRDSHLPYAKAPAPVGSATLRRAGTAAYSFTVTPTLATRYTVKLFARKTAASPLATSPVQNVYVSFGGTITTSGPCGPPTCRVTSHVFLIVPSSALKVEMSKRFYSYFAVKFGPPHGPTPPLPEWLYLNAGHASFTAAQRMSADKFEKTVTFSFACPVIMAAAPAGSGGPSITLASN